MGCTDSVRVFFVWSDTYFLAINVSFAIYEGKNLLGFPVQYQPGHSNLMRNVFPGYWGKDIIDVPSVEEKDAVYLDMFFSGNHEQICQRRTAG